MPDPISTLALATGGAFLGKFVGPAAEHLRKLALERAQHLGAKAAAMLAAIGREPQPIEPKLLVPLVQAASLESDPTLADKWTALLANAADPAHSITITPVYTDILRQLTPAEAKLLDKLFKDADETFQATVISYPDDKKPIVRKKDATKDVLHLEYIFYNFIQPPNTDFNEALRQAYDAMLDNLLRQQLIALANSEPAEPPFSAYDYMPDRTKGYFTSLGYDFMLAVTPPTA